MKVIKFQKKWISNGIEQSQSLYADLYIKD